MNNYILKTERLGLRNWQASDIDPFIEMGKDPEVMQYFPSLLSEKESRDFIQKLQQHFITYGYCYFAVDVLETSEFIGFTGFMNQTWKSTFTPCVDMGWRLKRNAWGKGYATEAAKACLEAALPKFNLKEVYAFTPDKNLPSQKVMQKIGMDYVGDFQHPKLIGDVRFEHCVAYKKSLINLLCAHTN